MAPDQSLRPEGGALMVIFSLGGNLLRRRLRGGAVRCRTAFLPLEGPPRVTLDPFPAREGKGVVEDGWARLLDGDGIEVARRLLRDAGRGWRWDDLDLLAFVATTLWEWLALPLRLDDPALVVHERDAHRLELELPDGWPGAGRRHVLHLDAEGRVRRHEGGDLVHELSRNCDFGGAELATSRRTCLRGRHTVVVWGDVVAAHVLPAPPPGGSRRAGPAAEPGGDSLN